MSTRPTLTLKRPPSVKELLKRDAKRDTSAELQDAMREIPAGPPPAGPQAASEATPTPPPVKKAKKTRPRRDADVPWAGPWWFTWSPTAFKPTRRHASEVSALDQAAALRQRFPLQRFHVFRSELVQWDDRPEEPATTSPETKQ